MKLLVYIFILIGFESIAQSPVTTFILVRHAEKMEGNMSDSANDPDLTEAGRQRAKRLAAMLKETKVDAVYTTLYKRTQNTVAPLALSKGVEVFSYDARKAGYADDMLNRFLGKTIVVCGHSNTIPGLANYLTGTDEIKNFADDDYDNILVVTVVDGVKGAKVVWLNY